MCETISPGQTGPLTPLQKLHSHALCHSNLGTWRPAKGDYFTPRDAGMDLFRILSIDTESVTGRSCNPREEGVEWIWHLNQNLSPAARIKEWAESRMVVPAEFLEEPQEDDRAKYSEEMRWED